MYYLRVAQRLSPSIFASDFPGVNIYLTPVNMTYVLDKGKRVVDEYFKNVFYVL